MLDNGSVITFKKEQYTLLESLGAGGQGSIWKVERQSDNAIFAMKVVHIYDLRAGRRIRHRTEIIDDLIVRAQEEITFLSSLTDAETHYIVPCLDSGIIKEEGFELPVMLMPVYARDLTDLTSAYRDEKNLDLDLAQLLDWVEQLAGALSYIHDSGSATAPRVHRDVKPGNLLLNEKKQLFLTDFGIVKAANNVGTTSIVYSYDFCAPEQRLAISEDDAGKRRYYITPAVDLYSLGMLIHELIAGSTRAQGELNDESNKNRHDRTLRNHESKNKRIGLLGQIGGLTEPEKGHLHRQLQKLAGIAQTPDTTVIVGKDISLPQKLWITFKFTNFIAELLSPWPDDRPNAQDTLSLVQQIRLALTPEVTQFELTPKQVLVQQNQAWTVQLKLRGDGLPADLHWLKVSLNKHVISHPDFQFNFPGNQDFLLPNDRDLSLKLTLPSTKELGLQTLEVSTYVADKPFSANVQCEVTPCAEFLWQKGKRAEALLLDLRSDWLNQWQQEAGTLTQRYEFVRILDILQKRYPDNADLNKRRQTLEKLDPSIKKQWLVPGLISLAILVGAVITIVNLKTEVNPKNDRKQPGNVLPDEAAIAVVHEATENLTHPALVANYALPSSESSPPFSIDPIESDLFSGAEEQQYDAWQSLLQLLEQYADHPEISQVQALKLRYEQETEAWLESTDPMQQQTAIIRLSVLGNSGDSNAQAWLGYFYLSGQIVDRNIETAKQWYQKAANQGNEGAIQQLNKLNGSWQQD